MQGLADGYFVAPSTVANYIASQPVAKADTNHAAFTEAAKRAQERIDKLLSINGTKTVDSIHKKLGHIMWKVLSER